MIEEKRGAENLVDNKNSENLIVYSDLILAARAGWRWIVVLTSLAIVLSLVWHTRRPPLYEVKATIRVGWVHDGVSTVPIEPIEDLVVMVKQERFLKPFFEDINTDTVRENEKNEFVESLSIKWAPKNVVEFKNISTSPENARVWLERLISFKVAEHEKIMNDFVAPRQRLVAECISLTGAKNPNGSAALLDRCSPQQLMLAHPMPPLMARTVVSQPVKVEESAVFPSLRFLIVASVVGGIVFGTLFSFAFRSYKCLNQSNPV